MTFCPGFRRAFAEEAGAKVALESNTFFEFFPEKNGRSCFTSFHFPLHKTNLVFSAETTVGELMSWWHNLTYGLEDILQMVRVTGSQYRADKLSWIDGRAEEEKMEVAEAPGSFGRCYTIRITQPLKDGEGAGIFFHGKDDWSNKYLI